MAIPDLEKGLLPGGVHGCTLDEAKVTFATDAPSSKRAVLWTSLEQYLQQIDHADVFTAAYIDGSFTTDKAEPGDIDLVMATELPPSVAIDRIARHNMLPLISRYVCKHQFGLEVFTAFLPADMAFIELFMKVKPHEAQHRGVSRDHLRGILRVEL